MKPSILTAFHYIIFFWAVLLLTPPKNLDQKSNECNKQIELKIEKNDQVSIAKENTTDLLHGELLFKF